jgi:chemotaxis response regulator CheB
MPKMAYERGGVVKQLPFEKILNEIIDFGRL